MGLRNLRSGGCPWLAWLLFVQYRWACFLVVRFLSARGYALAMEHLAVDMCFLHLTTCARKHESRAPAEATWTYE